MLRVISVILLVWAVVVVSLFVSGFVVGYTTGERAGMARRRKEGKS